MSFGIFITSQRIKSRCSIAKSATLAVRRLIGASFSTRIRASQELHLAHDPQQLDTR